MNILNFLKILSAGGVTFVIWLVMLTAYSPEEPVKEAEADIAAFGFAPESQQKRFINAVQKLGFEKPRRYNWNGNDVWFSTTKTSEEPRQALERIQRTLVEEKVNDVSFDKPYPQDVITKENYVDVANERMPYLQEMLGGGMAPIASTDDGFTLVGNSPKSKSKRHHDLLRDLRDGLRDDPKSLFGQMRYIDGMRESGGTRMTAVWTAEPFNTDKALNKGTDLNVNTAVPICAGCKRISRMVGEEGRYDATTVDAGFRDPKDVHRFYHQALTGRGWATSHSSVYLEARRLSLGERGKLLASYQREGEFLTLTIFRNETGGTTATVVQSP